MALVFEFDDVGNHASMLLDRIRVDAFARAIGETVGPGDVVADIGAGSGLLAIIAAQRGARRVYAVERGALALLLADAVRDNGVSDIVEIMRADARDVVFPEPPTVLVSETLGSFGIDEDILGLLKNVRPKAHPSCRVIPMRFEVELALALVPELEEELRVMEVGLPVRLLALRAALASRVTVTSIPTHYLCTSIGATGALRPGTDELPRALACEVVASRTSRANAIVGWFDAQLSPSVSLRSGPGPQSPSWSHVVLPLDPPLELTPDQCVALEVRPSVVTERGTWAWSARRGDDVTSGDAMRALVGDKNEVLGQLGLRPKTADPRDGLQPGDVALFARRLREAFPARYRDDATAEQDILRLRHAGDR
jgi:protein arginine N-methyltransferase 1